MGGHPQNQRCAASLPRRGCRPRDAGGASTAETKHDKDLSEILLIVRDFVRRNFERLRTVEHEKDAAFNRHIEDLVSQIDYHRKQVTKYSVQFFRYAVTIISLIILCGVTIGIMIMMFVNNRALSSQVKDLQEHRNRSIISRPDKPHESCDTYP